MRRSICAVSLVLLVVGLYGGSLHYGLIWDDPQWLAAVARLSLVDHMRGLPDYQFYRPLTTLYFASWVRADGTVDPLPMHAVQVALHAVCTLLVWRTARLLGSSRVVAYLAGLLFAVFPYSQQATAWAGAHQPLGTAALLTAVWAFTAAATRSLVPRNLDPSAARLRVGRSGLLRADPVRTAVPLLALAVGAYTAAVLLQEAAVPLALLFPLTALSLARAPTHAREAGAGPLPNLVARTAWVFPAIAGVFTLVWLTRPRLEGITGSGMDEEVLGYLAQAAFYPVALLAARPELTLATATVTLVGLAVLADAALPSLTSARTTFVQVALGRPALSLTWIVLAVAPVWMALGSEYVLIGPRLLYPAAFGIAWFWAQLLGVLVGADSPWRRAVGTVAALALVATSIDMVSRLNRLQAEGAALVREAVQVLTDQEHHERRVVFVNFPDRLRLEPPPLTVGFWGALLAPIDTDLTLLALTLQPNAVESESRSFPSIGHEVRSTASVRTDLRGVQAYPGELTGVTDGSSLWLTEYNRPFQMNLSALGHQGDWPADLTSGVPQLRATQVEFGEFAQLLGSALVPTSIDSRPIRVDSAWRALGRAGQDETLFLHVLDGRGRRVASADGDWWGGTVPLSARAPGDGFVDSRFPVAVSPETDRIERNTLRQLVGERMPDAFKERWPLVPGSSDSNSSYPSVLGGPNVVRVHRWHGLPPGRYRVGLGIYNRVSGDRVSVAGSGIPVDSHGRITVGWVEVRE